MDKHFTLEIVTPVKTLDFEKVEYLRAPSLEGLFGVMPTIKRISNNPYQWKIEATSIERIANVEKKLPKSFISSDGFGITKKGADYFRPLLGKRDASDIKNYPVFTKGKLKLVSKKLLPWNDCI